MQNCNTRRSAVIQVLTQLADVMRIHLLNGDKVSVLDLGTFCVGINNPSVEEPADFDPSKNINSFRINFQPITRRTINGQTYYPMLSGIEALPKP